MNRSHRVSEAQFCSHHTRPTYCTKSNKTGDKALQLKKKKKVALLCDCFKTFSSGGPRSGNKHILTTLLRHELFFNGDTLLITIYFEVMRCQQQNRQQVRLDKYLIVARVVGYGQQHWVTQQGNSFPSAFPTKLPGKAKDGQLLNCGINHARVTNVRIGV